jgi:hypothetical protein
MTKKMIRLSVTGEPSIHRPETVIVELPESQFKDMNPDAREKALFDAAEEATQSMFTWGYEVLGDGE